VNSPDQFPVEHGFRMRGAGISRIDVFSDVVFAFALALLAVSLTVPRNSRGPQESILGLVIVGICFAMILGGWFSHYVFFRRYGLRDRVTIILNSCLLFLILFCVYPLKVLFASISGYVFRESSSTWLATTIQVNGRLFLYALGFAAVFFLVAALYWNAWRHRESLALNGIERLLTVSSIVDALGLAAIGLIACLAGLVLPSAWCVYSAALYLLVVPWKTLNGIYFGRKARTLRKLVAAPTL
jgi:Endosomal/lysosomal potassium channel TMEM175